MRYTVHMKTCSKCHQAQPLDNYNIQNASKDGHCAYCRDCQREYNRTVRTPRQRELYHQNRDKHLEYQQNWRDANRETINSRTNELRRTHRINALNILGGACECCGERTFEFLSIDHINGGGREERKTLNSQQLVYKLIKEGKIEGYRVLCHNCNLALGIYKSCPHKK